MTENQKKYHPLRDYASFFSPKRLIDSESAMIEKVQILVKRYYYQEQDFDFFRKREVGNAEAKDLQMSAAVFRFLSLNNTKTKIRALGFAGIETATSLASLTQKAFDYLNHGLKKAGKTLSIKQLLVKAKAFLKENFSLSRLIHKNKGNAHAAKAWTKEAQDVLLGLYANPESDIKLLESQVYDEYNKIARGEREIVNPHTGELITAETKSLPVIKSRSTIWNFFQNPWIQRVTAKLRHGSKYYNDHYKPYVKGVKPRYALSFVSSDGQVIPFRLRKNGVDTYKRALCYFVFDVATGAVIGYSIAESETKQVMSEAFADMMVNTKGVKPHEVQLDNFGKSYLKELEQIFPQVSFCKPLNPQSKYAERFIAHFEQQYCRKQEGWTGANITARNKHNAHRRNADIAQKTYSMTEIKAMYKGLIAAYNKEIIQEASGQTRWEVLESTVNPGCEKIADTTLASLFAKSTLSSIDRGYVLIQISGQKHYFRVPEVNAVGVKMANGKRVRVRYLPHMLDTKVWLYNFDKHDHTNTANDTYLSEAIALEGAQRAKAEQTLEDTKNLGKLDRWATDTEKADDEAATQIQSFELASNDPEAVLSAGYTNKNLMQEAEEKAGEGIVKAVEKAKKVEDQRKEAKKQKRKSAVSLRL
ncbi:hypothetical protein [uncultured Microscilla sp.]|uniref:hypothetical protein n=1 Tax=uncultured Microscilla sp. TaxID=432653 RepID=UPI002632FCF9|nr:hypothetical protein [uncultured Microscilla sp.]